MSDLTDLIGLQYELGADGSAGTVDCIHLCLIALDRFGIARPPVNPRWYQMSRLEIGRELYRWGSRIGQPKYDGDILLLPQEAHAFGVTWQQGALYINGLSRAVQWCPLGLLPTCHCFRGNASLSKPLT